MQSISFSLRTTIALVAYCGLVFSGLRTGGTLAAIASLGLVIFAVAMTIRAAICQNEKRAFAIGFVFAFLSYMAFHLITTDEHNRFGGPSPARTLILFAHGKTVEMELIDLRTGESRPYNGEVAGGMRQTEIRITPDISSFVMLGHFLLADIAGLVGGFYALVARKQIASG
jgi:hypothetical protein